MGKIFSKFTNFLYPDGVDLYTLNQIFSSIAGDTYLDQITFNNNIWIVYAKNDLFLDGTEIVAHYKNHFTTGTSLLFVFDGVDIIDPPAVQSGGTTNIGSVNTISFNSTHASINPLYPTHIYIDPNTQGLSNTPTILNPCYVCVCGAEKVGGLHSSWCYKKD